MGTVNRFEDLIAWHKARIMTREIYAVTKTGTFARDFALRDQIRRAAVSVMANLAEGFERGKRSEFHQFSCIAKGSCGEVRSHLYIALDAGHIERDTFQRFYVQCDEVVRIIGGLRNSLERTRGSGRP